MKLLRLFPLELGRLLHSRMTWLIVLLTVISPAVGLVLYKPAIASTMLSMYLANPALAGGAAGGILFGLLTVYELDRAGRSRVEVLTNAVVSPLAAALVRLPALLAAAGLALVLTMLVWLPISCGLIGSIFDGGDYVLAYLLFMGLALPLSILAASAASRTSCAIDGEPPAAKMILAQSLTVTKLVMHCTSGSFSRTRCNASAYLFIKPLSPYASSFCIRPSTAVFFKITRIATPIAAPTTADGV